MRYVKGTSCYNIHTLRTVNISNSGFGKRESDVRTRSVLYKTIAFQLDHIRDAIWEALVQTLDVVVLIDMLGALDQSCTQVCFHLVECCPWPWVFLHESASPCHRRLMWEEVGHIWRLFARIGF